MRNSRHSPVKIKVPRIPVLNQCCNKPGSHGNHGALLLFKGTGVVDIAYLQIGIALHDALLLHSESLLIIRL